MSLPYGPPQAVSPLIRGVRFALLLAGIIYAQGKQRLYNSMEASYREEEARKKVIRDKQMAILKAKIAAEEKEAVRLLETGKLFDTGPGGGGGGGSGGSGC
ncbi:uncharacterized protein LOC114352582 [Ostrinia furnacalis]|uniref:uncharacterized protein LOC114352582 n=1 Tax=Ostrinia furnacalis TaxID=93504 RepID=UPI001038677E|nr:uncharacterized protein LOC114352582 [Ostrinia furnacalis]XP_028160029.1 uncharacterized protein LOC114352582 [Ostrinia furnacalis]